MSAPTAVLGGERESPTRYFDAVRRHWVLVALAALLAVNVAAYYSVTATKQYKAEADVLVTPLNDSDNTFVGIDVMRQPDKSVLIIGRMLKSEQVADAVARRLRLEETGHKLLRSVAIKPIQQSNVVAIIAKARSPARAASVANAFAGVLVSQRTGQFQRELRAAISRLRETLPRAPATSRAHLADRMAALQAQVGAPDPTVGILSRAIRPSSPSSPRLALIIIVALLAGLVFGVGAALLLEFVDPRLVAENELVGRLPILARIPRAPGRVVRKYLKGRASLPAELWEAYRTLRASLGAHGLREGSAQSILVTSAMKGEGKTVTSVNLAITLAAAGFRVVLVDGDFRRSMVASAFGIPVSENGFAALLFGSASPEEALIPAPGYGDQLRLLLAGSERPVDLLERQRIERALAHLKLEADVIIIDSPAVTEFADAIALADAVDILLVAVRLGYSRRDKFNELLPFLTHHRISPAGLVVTSRRRSRDRGYPPGFDKDTTSEYRRTPVASGGEFEG